MKKQTTLSVTETAKLLGCTTKYVYDLLRLGALDASKSDRKWSISKSAVHARIAKRTEK